MKFVFYLFLFIVLSFKTFGGPMTDLEKVDSLVDHTNLLLSMYPSMGLGLTGIDDYRIKLFAKKQQSAF